MEYVGIELKLEDIFMMLKKRWLLIVSFVVLGMAASGVYTVLTYTPVYSAYTTILVNRDNTSGIINSSDYYIGKDLLSTFQGVINSDKSRTKITEELGSQNMGSISISSSYNSIIQINVSHANPDMAVQVANITAKVFQDIIKEMMSDMESSILDEAKVSHVSNGMNLSTKVMLGAILGGMISVGICFIREYLNKTFKSQKEVITALNLPVIGVIPEIRVK